MRRTIAVVAIALAVVGSALAAPKDRPHRRHHGKAAGSGSAVGSGSGSAGSGSGSGGGSGSSAQVIETNAGSGSAAPPAPVTPAITTTPPTGIPPTTLAMRPKQADQHDGFVADMDCKACHTSDGWAIGQTAGKSGFDHDRTGFPLRGAHVQTTCTRCHTGTAKLPTTCDGCHHDTHQGRLGTTCAECHTAVAWSDVDTFAQHRRTRLPLTGATR